MADAAKTVWEQLSARFDAKDIRWRPQSIVDSNFKSQKGVKPGQYPDGCKAKFLAYIDARNVMDRLDAVVGPEAWSDTYRELEHDGKGHVLSVECSLTIQGVTKVDVGYRNAPDNDSEAEPAKAAYSDAFKRAAVKFGVGRFLYDMGDSGWIPVDKWGKATKAMPGSPDAAAEKQGREDVKAAVDAVKAERKPEAERDWLSEVELLKAVAKEHGREKEFAKALGSPNTLKQAATAFKAMSEPARKVLANLATGEPDAS